MTSLPARAGRAEAGSLATAVRTRLLTRDGVAAATLAVAAWVWVVPVTHGSGGQAPWRLTLGLLALVPPLLANRPWRVLGTWHVVMASAPAVAALAVCLTTATGFDGLDELALLGAAGLAYLAVGSWASSDARREIVLVVVALAGLEQFSQAYLAWWGGGTVERRMVGTFYWHNQYAAFALATGLVAVVLATRGRGPARIVGWACSPLLLSSLAFASSRACLGLAVLGLTVLGVLAIVDRRGRLATLGVVVASLGVGTLLSSSLLMPVAGSVGSTVAARETQQSLAGNGSARLELWRAALELGTDHPVTGAGFDSFAGAGTARLPIGASPSVYAHNGYLQAFADGGLVLLLALLLATAVPFLTAAWGARSIEARRSAVHVVATPLALGALGLHALVDFDWTYPSLAVLFAVLAVPPRRRSVAPPPRPAAGPARAAALCGGLLGILLLTVLPASARSSGVASPGLAAPTWARVASFGLPLSGSVSWLPAAGPCRAQLLSPDPAVRRHGLRCGTSADVDDPGLALLRARAEVRTGHVGRGLARAESTMTAWGDRRPQLGLPFALVLADGGRPHRATRTADRLRRMLLSRGLVTQLAEVDRVIALQASAWADGYSRTANPPITSGREPLP